VKRRQFLLLPAALLTGPGLAQSYARVVPGRPLAFPRDHGAHPDFRTEWWYITGWLRGARESGFQITFFRNRPLVAEHSKSSFAPRQLLFAHAALADAGAGRLIHDQRSARTGFGIAQYDEADTRVKIDDWTLERAGRGYRARIAAREFELDLAFEPAQAPLAQGAQGYSRKGPRPEQASYYYSWPQLAVKGAVTRGAIRREAAGVAWLDHEWSSEALAPEAAGWDWCGINGDDGSALMAFRIRARDGSTYWAGGSHRARDGRLRVFPAREVRFETLAEWRSPRSGATYPVSVRVSAGGMSWTLVPLMEDQELDARASTGTVYWEGAVRASQDGRPAGRGYLELTGYAAPLKL
jgi:predicted secreted hydrolase